jgi:hypothetical protein
LEEFVQEVMKARIFHARRFRGVVTDFAVKIRRRNSMHSMQSAGSTPIDSLST